MMYPARMNTRTTLRLAALAALFLSACAPRAADHDMAGMEQGLRAAVTAAVDDATDSVWDKQVLIDEMDSSHSAAKGKWVAKDHWDWIAWQGSGSAWTVLVSLDGFDCARIEDIPARFDAFFKDRVYMYGAEKPYCHDWKD